MIRESFFLNHAGNRHKCHARYGCADGGYGHDVPGRLAVSDEETGVVGLAARNIRNKKQQSEVGRNGGNDNRWAHKFFNIGSCRQSYCFLLKPRAQSRKYAAQS